MGTAKNKNKNKSAKRLEKSYGVKNSIVNYYLFLMFAIFPLFYTDAYFNIRHDKLYFFIVVTAIVIVAEVLIFLTVNLESSAKNRAAENDDNKQWYQKLSFTDWAMLAFLAINLFSTLLSNRTTDAFWGTAGRNNGLLLMAFYVAVYFVITRYYRFKEYVFLAFSAASAIVFILAVLNGFYIDPLNMAVNLDEQTALDFTSTIGNKNLLSSYICVSLPVFITMAVHTEKNSHRAVYLLTCGLGFASLMTADSDSGILGIGVFLVIFLVWYSKRISRLKRYFLSLTVMLAFAKLLRLFSYIMDDNSKGMDEFQNLFVYSGFSYAALAAAGVITALLYLLDYKKPGIVLPKTVPIAIGSAAAVCAAAIIGVVIYFSTVNTTADLGSMETILRFNDKWGTHRGFMWIRSMWIFSDASFIQKLFGTGPDTFYYAFSPYFSELSNYGDSSTNAAHNEYINYLITIGIAGLASYLAVVGGAVARAIKTARKNPLAIVCISAVICYSIQAVVNIAQPITTPLFILFIALTEAVGRETSVTGRSSFEE
ncbi:MAG: O-antigen ligase family protein [Clostridiales bacterium]|nr:O-antigen ligase family protein [Clostridiales bacterium]